MVTGAACQTGADRVSEQERAAVVQEIHQRVTDAYDLSKPDAVARLMSLYPDSGPVYSATGGRVTASRDSLEHGIRAFWENVGRNMRSPRWVWTAMHVDVVSHTSAVMTATYRVVHTTPQGQPHVLGGAWTAAFAKQKGRWLIVHEHLSDAPPMTLTEMMRDSAALGGAVAHTMH